MAIQSISGIAVLSLTLPKIKHGSLTELTKEPVCGGVHTATMEAANVEKAQKTSYVQTTMEMTLK
jgi:hypothetical protein